jgi:phenylalanyl-tRNA synthetase beta chain
MRPSILPGLLNAVLANNNRFMENLRFFEIGNIYGTHYDDRQELSIGVLRSRFNAENNIYAKAREVDCMDAKADLLALLHPYGIEQSELVPNRVIPLWYHPCRSVSYRMRDGSEAIGHCGELHPALSEKYGVKQPVAMCELFPDRLPKLRERPVNRGEINFVNYPTVERDFAFLVYEDTVSQDIIDTIIRASRAVIRDVKLFDIYEGDNLPEGRISMAFKVLLQAPDHTLTEEEITEISKAIIEKVDSSCSGILRQN